MQRVLLLAFLFSAFPLFLTGQPSEDLIASLSFKRSERATTVLMNKEGLLPLQRLDTLRIAHLSFGKLQTGPFLKTLNNYAPVTPVEVPFDITEEWLAEQRNRFNLFIIELEDIAIAGQVPAVYNYKDFIQPIIDQLPSIVFINGDGSILQVMPFLRNAQGMLITPSHEDMGTVVAAQIVMGAVAAQGKLRGGLRGTNLRTGDGYTYPGGEHLRYTPYDYAEIDQAILEDSIAAIVEEGIAKGAYPGAQVLVARHGNVVYHKAFGHHTFDRTQAVKTDDLYDLASVTKISSALPALMKLHGAGQFNLDAPLKTYMPEFKGSNKGDLTFRSMLAHHARLRPWIPYWQGTLRGHSRYPWQKKWDKERINDGRFRWFTFKADSSKRFPIYVTDNLWLHRKYKKRIYKAIKKSPLNEEPGYVYSGLLFYLLPEIVADLTGTAYTEYLDQNFYHRLGAFTLGYRPLEAFTKSRIVPTERDTFFRMQQLHGYVHDEGAAMMGGISANAGLFANANDLAKLMHLYMNNGRAAGEQLIDSASVAEFTRYQYSEEGNRRGLGFDKPMLEYDSTRSYVAKSASPSSFGHSGYTGTFTWADPESGLLLVFLSNRVYPTRENRKLYELNIRPRLHEVLYQAIKED
ncbi:MAG: serine hydrolase domain-containing protein [Phaeodactylibacter sp.]|uniref:serine hydrolase domain-containing protein n=1 Tax=Phaeodactylibacter sp. TaxID=1940289 RepID=UPI0032EAEB8B